MRYVAVLQRFDASQCEVAGSDDRAEAVAAATAVYTALIPQAIERGRKAIVRRAREEAHDVPDEYLWRAQAEREDLADELRAEEWLVAVYDTVEREHGYPTQIFYVGADLENDGEFTVVK